MRTGDLSRLFGVSNKTINRWVEAFGDYLSDDARRAGGRQSHFNQADFLVLATVAELSQRKKLPHEAIREKLQEGYRVEDVSASTVGYEDGRLVPAAAVEQIIDSAEIRIELEQVRNERDRLLEEVKKLEERLTDTEAEKKMLLTEIKELQRALGRAEGRLEEIEYNRGTQRGQRDS